MKVATIEFGKGDVSPDGKLKPEARQKLKEQLMNELQGIPEDVQASIMGKLGGALDGLIDTGDLASLSARFILEGLERAEAILDGLPQGVRLLAKAQRSGPVTFELGQASGSISLAQAILEIAIRDMKHFLECSCSPLNESKDSDKPDNDGAARETAPTQDPLPS